MGLLSLSNLEIKNMLNLLIPYQCFDQLLCNVELSSASVDFG